jgi:hypothetical protein
MRPSTHQAEPPRYRGAFTAQRKQQCMRTSHVLFVFFSHSQYHGTYNQTHLTIRDSFLNPLLFLSILFATVHRGQTQRRDRETVQLPSRFYTPSPLKSHNMSSNTSTTATPCPPTTIPPSQSHIQFGATPHRAPMRRFPSSYTRSTHSVQSQDQTTTSELSPIQTTQPSASASSSPAQPAQNFSDMVPATQLKSMSDLDKEEEARLAETHRVKAVKMGVGIYRWVGKLAKGKMEGGEK